MILTKFITVKLDLPLVATKVVNAGRNHLDPSHLLQNAEGIVYERKLLYLVAFLLPHMTPVIKIHQRFKKICTTGSI